MLEPEEGRKRAQECSEAMRRILEHYRCRIEMGTTKWNDGEENGTFRIVAEGRKVEAVQSELEVKPDAKPDTKPEQAAEGEKQ